MQGRTIPNSLHLLVVLDQMKTLNFEDLLSFILKRKELSMDLKSLDVIERIYELRQVWAGSSLRTTWRVSTTTRRKKSTRTSGTCPQLTCLMSTSGRFPIGVNEC